MIAITVLLTLFGISSSCNSLNWKYYDEQLKLSRIKNSVNDSLWNYFPDNINSSTRVITAYNPSVLNNIFNYYGISIRQNLTTKDFKSKIKQLKKHAIFEFDEKESRSLVNNQVFFFDAKTNYSPSDVQCGIKFIVPNNLCEYNIFEGQVSSDANLIVLDSNFGLYNSNEFLKFSNSLHDHGVSRGVYYINDKNVIYY